MKLMGVGDEAANSIDGQIQATQELGWEFIELRAVEVSGFPRANFHDIPETAFDLAARKLEASGLQVHGFGSAIMNWAKKVGDPFAITLAEVKRTIPRMQRLGAKYVRIMSFKPEDDAYETPTEVFRRVSEVTKRFLDAGLQPLHENCMNHGGMSWQHALELLDQCPGLQWLFDPANPVFNPDRSKPKPWPKQDPWEFLDTGARTRGPHPHQGRDVERHQKRRGLHLARRRPRTHPRHFAGRNGARLRRGHFHRDAHGLGFSRRKAPVQRRVGDATEFRRIWPANGTTPQRGEGGAGKIRIPRSAPKISTNPQIANRRSAGLQPTLRVRAQGTWTFLNLKYWPTFVHRKPAASWRDLVRAPAGEMNSNSGPPPLFMTFNFASSGLICAHGICRN